MLLEDENYVYYYKHLRSSNGSRAMISDGTVRFTDPLDFNDPFDCCYDAEDGFLGKTSAEIAALLRRYQQPKMSPANRHMATKKIVRLHRQKIKDGRFFAEMNKHVGVVCLNQSPLNILMWSHYAENHKGFLVELKFPKETLKSDLYGDFIPIPVKYVKDYPIMTKEDKRDNSKIDKAYFHKSEDWSYECEFRVVVSGLTERIMKYPRDIMLCSVIAGLRVTDEDFVLLQQAVKTAEAQMNLEVPLYRVESVPKKYELTVKRHPRLDRKTWSKSK